MSKYSDFVKSYMAKHGKTWNCAVCEIKKSGAYETYKKGGTEKKTVSASINVSIPVPFNVEQASQVKTIAPSPIPAAAPLVEKPAIRQPTATLVMPDDIGMMIQDFIRPTGPPPRPISIDLRRLRREAMRFLLAILISSLQGVAIANYPKDDGSNIPLYDRVIIKNGGPADRKKKIEKVINFIYKTTNFPPMSVEKAERILEEFRVLKRENMHSEPLERIFNGFSFISPRTDAWKFQMHDMTTRIPIRFEDHVFDLYKEIRDKRVLGARR